MLKYRTIELTSEQGYKTADRLHMNGWKTVRIGLTYVVMEKKDASRDQRGNKRAPSVKKGVKHTAKP